MGGARVCPNSHAKPNRDRLKNTVLPAYSMCYYPSTNKRWDSSGCSPQQKTRKTFHATMQVTRIEEWCVEAETPEEARALLAGGSGNRYALGECIHAEIEKLLDD